MIPYSICNGQIIQNQKMICDFSINDLSVYHFTMRLPSFICLDQVEFLIFFYQLDTASFQSVLLTGKVESIEKKQFYYEFRINIENPLYSQMVRKLMREYAFYIDCKMNDQLEKISNYPSDLDAFFPKSYSEFLLKPLMNLDVSSEYGKKIQKIGICLQDYRSYQDYLNMEDYTAYYFKKLKLDSHPLASQQVKYLYVGNQGCFELFPDLETLNRILEKAVSEDRKVIIVFPPVKENKLEQVHRILEHLSNIEEVVINDFGMIEMLKEYPRFKVTAGVLLIKHKKDPRMEYKSGYTPYYYSRSNIHTDFYSEFLKKQNIDRISIEANRQYFEPLNNTDIYFPFYITNLATICSLKAIVENHDRSRMITDQNCPRYCEKQHCLYPVHLSMIGRYNGLYGYDPLLLEKNLDVFLKAEHCRIILNF